MQDNNELSHIALLESLLFVASGPVSTSRLGIVLGISAARVGSYLGELAESYADGGLRLQWIGQSVQLTSAPEASSAIERFLGLEVTTRLSQAALEVLAIIAYMQPITRPSVDQIRGVNSDAALRTLLSKGLIEERGRMDSPGRPILYGTTTEFLQHFGLSIIDDLPALADEEE
jgi:segregation and condensation protein B